MAKVLTSECFSCDFDTDSYRNDKHLNILKLHMTFMFQNGFLKVPTPIDFTYLPQQLDY